MNKHVFHSVNPVDNITVGSYEILSHSQLEIKLSQLSSAGNKWCSIKLEDRIDAIRRIKVGLINTRDILARRITLEMGKPLAQSEAEIDKCISLCAFYVDQGASFLVDTATEYTGMRVLATHQPIGTVLGIMPWNFPVWQTLRYTVPALLVGNAVLLKPAPNVLGTSLILEQIIADAIGLEGVFQVLILEVDDVERVIAHPSVQGVTLTGSDRAGSAVASLAGKYIKKSVLELGGSDPFIVLHDSDIASAAQAFVTSRMNNTGQTCIAAKRALVDSNIKNDFIDAVAENIRNIKMGDPLNLENNLSCLARADLTDKLQYQLKDALGTSRLIVEGGREGDSNYFRPVFLEATDDKSPMWSEEIFGPIAVVRSFSSIAEAITLANSTEYGLGCSIWSADESRALEIARSIDAGSIHINKFVSSDPRVPFGGVKRSGFGREMGREGVYEFSNLKTITLQGDTGT